MDQGLGRQRIVPFQLAVRKIEAKNLGIIFNHAGVSEDPFRRPVVFGKLIDKNLVKLV